MAFMVREVFQVQIAFSKAPHFTLMQGLVEVFHSLRDHKCPELKSLTSAVRAKGANGMSA